MNEADRSRYEPLSWLLVFTTTTSMKWVERLVPGKFKHVMAAGWVEASKVWIFYDVQFRRTSVLTMPEKEGLDYFGRIVARDPDHGILRVFAGNGTPAMARLGFWCVPAIKHLVGARSGALRPDRLWHDCLASGAETVHGFAEPKAVSAVAARDRGAKSG